MRIEENKFLRNYLMYYGKKKNDFCDFIDFFQVLEIKKKKKFNYNEKK